MEFDWNKPDFINPQGIKWWLDKTLSDYANKPNQFGICLENWKVFVVEEKNGNRTRLLVDDKHQIIDDNSSVEGIACKIDIIKVNEELKK